MKGIRFFVLGLFLLALAAGCQRLPMHERGAGVYVRISVDETLDPSMEAYLETRPSLREKIVGKLPEMLFVGFYDVESHQLVMKDYLPVGGGFVDVPAGVYDVIVYGLGTEVTQVSGTEGRAGAYAFTDPSGTRVKQASQEHPLIFEPDPLFTGTISSAYVPVRPDDAETVVLSAGLSRISESWILEFPNVEGAEHIREAAVYVTGQASGRFLWDRRKTGQSSAIALESTIDVQNGRIESVFNTFGKYPQADGDVQVMVLVTTNGGARCLYLFDATDQWLNPDNSAHRLIFEERMVIPGDDYQGGGVDPVVFDWDNEDITVIIGV